MLTRRRNAWHSTTINQYFSTEPLFTDLAAAERAAEKRRERGTYFEIDAGPVLVCDLGDSSLVVSHLNTSQPFANWTAPRHLTEGDTPVTGLDLVKSFGELYFRDAESGWPLHAGQPTVIVGIVSSFSLSIDVGDAPFTVRRSEVEAGEMYFTEVRTDVIDTTAVARIAEELGRIVTMRNEPDNREPGEDYFLDGD
ncbi:hypothetical protein [Cryobacterium tagatosivorans]|uniref:Uncharacterized protein n=1 Tax=Cryobacterium tagatosivorans TaxID=1259199 RepID=A0A4R8UEA6_9MICO|nr:hypothetical protein [Cryobacterium tagatosivorans]TFB48702.1 hypothetical protein E3O23_12850 [Cryobacterium tagatosivorans]